MCKRVCMFVTPSFRNHCTDLARNGDGLNPGLKHRPLLISEKSKVPAGLPLKTFRLVTHFPVEVFELTTPGQGKSVVIVYLRCIQLPTVLSPVNSGSAPVSYRKPIVTGIDALHLNNVGSFFKGFIFTLMRHFLSCNSMAIGTYDLF